MLISLYYFISNALINYRARKLVAYWKNNKEIYTLLCKYRVKDFISNNDDSTLLQNYPTMQLLKLNGNRKFNSHDDLYIRSILQFYIGLINEILKNRADSNTNL